MREFVADVGNSRIKWGECSTDASPKTLRSEDSASRLTSHSGRRTNPGLSRTAAVPLDEPDTWATLFRDWQVDSPAVWTLAGANPEARDRLATWLNDCGQCARIIDDYRQLPIRVIYDPPESVGIDRLLNAVAVVPRVPPGTSIIIVNAGSAVTVDLVNRDGAFAGGAIFPGARMMAKALHNYTARLPLVERIDGSGAMPPRHTQAAIACGISNAIVGGVERLVKEMSVDHPRVFLAGGDVELLRDLSFEAEMAGPYLTLDGIRLAARNLK
jgi:type III pantothenate kinase